MDKLEQLIKQAREWKEDHRLHRRLIDAAAAAIREKALLDAKAAILADQK